MSKYIKIGIGLVLGATATGGVVIDNQINPYTDKGDRQEIIITQEILETGESKIELIKARPEMRLKKWNNEVNLGVSYSKVTGQGKRGLLSNKMEWKDAKEEVHAYPIDNNNFEFEVILKEKPDTNVFDFQIDGAENLDFFYQPALNQQEIDEGDERPENVVGSYAVYHKEKRNHKVGDINYATGKAFHIYRPKAIDSNGMEQWAELFYEGGVLKVTVPQSFLDNAVYPVRVDPTFGNTNIGASGTIATNIDNWRGYKVTATGTGIVTKLTAYGQDDTGNPNIKPVIVLQSDLNILTNGIGDSTNSPSATLNWYDFTYTTGPTVTLDTIYIVGYVLDAYSFRIAYDTTSGVPDVYLDTTNSYSSPSNPTDATTQNRKISIYATYTASGGASPSTVSDIIFFE